MLDAKHKPGKDSTNIRVEHRHTLVEGEGGNRCGGVVTYPGQGQQFVVGTRYLAVKLVAHHDRGIPQPQSAARVAQSVPSANDLRRACCRQVSRSWPGPHPVPPGGCDARNRSLLRHHLADKYPPSGGIRRTPGQIPRLVTEPLAHSRRNASGNPDINGAIGAHDRRPFHPFSLPGALTDRGRGCAADRRASRMSRHTLVRRHCCIRRAEALLAFPP